MAFRGKKSAEGRVELLIGSGSVKVAVCDAVEEGEVRCAVLFRCRFSILYFSCGLSISRRKEQEEMPYRSSRRNGGAPKAERTATLTEGTALMGASRLTRAAAAIQERCLAIVAAFCSSSSSAAADHEHIGEWK